jgi:hypothetical protein
VVSYRFYEHMVTAYIIYIKSAYYVVSMRSQVY